MPIILDAVLSFKHERVYAGLNFVGSPFYVAGMKWRDLTFAASS